MIYNNIEFHNVEETETKGNLAGLYLQRFPTKIRNSLGYSAHERGRFYAQTSAGCELRFVSPSPNIRISLSALEGDCTVSVFMGDFFYSAHQVKAGVISTLHLEYPEALNLVNQSVFKSCRFSKNVWRICFDKNCCGCFYNIDAFSHSIRPPKKSEKPLRTWLAYGSSITMGGNCERYNNCYVEQAARFLGCDVLNKGIAGSCFAESTIIDYLARLDEWDFASLELGINMLSRFTPEEFSRRVKNAVERFAETGKSIFVIGLFDSHNSYGFNTEIKEKALLFNQIVEAAVSKNGIAKYGNVHYLSGSELLADFSGLSCDLLHPSDDGHIDIGRTLAAKMRSCGL